VADIVALRRQLARAKSSTRRVDEQVRSGPRRDTVTSLPLAQRPVRPVSSAGRPATRIARTPAPVRSTPPASSPDLAGLLASTGLAGLVRPATGGLIDAAPGVDRLLPVLPGLRSLLPGGGLRRGSTVVVAAHNTEGTLAASRGSAGASSLLLAVLAQASAAGSWCAVVGWPSFGAVAAAEMGIALDRVALIPHPGPDWVAVVAALLDGIDLVVTVPPGPVAPTVTSRLAARARQRGSVLIPFGRWEGADLVLSASASRWIGLDAGSGRLRRRELTVSVRGRGAASTPRVARLWLPGSLGTAPATPAETSTTSGQHTGHAGLRVVAG
jgi:hypothetical protein